MVSNEGISPLFDATILATEEAVINALVAADTMVGANNRRVIGLPHDRLREVLRKYTRLVNPAS
jgi:L-aminopeptidase/D-esterase-like protein